MITQKMSRKKKLKEKRDEFITDRLFLISGAALFIGSSALDMERGRQTSSCRSMCNTHTDIHTHTHILYSTTLVDASHFSARFRGRRPDCRRGYRSFLRPVLSLLSLSPLVCAALMSTGPFLSLSLSPPHIYPSLFFLSFFSIGPPNSRRRPIRAIAQQEKDETTQSHGFFKNRVKKMI